MSTSSGPDDGGSGPPRHGFLAWFVFLLAIAVVLLIAGGCMAVMYAPVVTG